MPDESTKYIEEEKAEEAYHSHQDEEIKAKDARIKELEARLEAAENFIHLSPSDSDITTKQWNAYQSWLALGGRQ